MQWSVVRVHSEGKPDVAQLVRALIYEICKKGGEKSPPFLFYRKQKLTIMPNRQKVPLGSSKSYRGRGIVVYEPAKEDLELGILRVRLKSIVKSVKELYPQAIRSKRQQIDDALRPFYGKALPFSENMLGTIMLKIINMQDTLGANTLQVANTIRKYMGYYCRFYRKVDNREIPIESERIMAAYKAIEEQKPIQEIQKILYD